MAAEIPDLPQVRASVEEIERLRTTRITRGPTTWPVDLKKLPGIFLDCVRAVGRLHPGAEGVEGLAGTLKRLMPGS